MRNPVREAKAIVYFRMLRSVGCFFPIEGTQHFVFRHCRCCAPFTEDLPNGLPDPVLEQELRGIVEEFSHDLGPLCREHFRSA